MALVLSTLANNTAFTLALETGPAIGYRRPVWPGFDTCLTEPDCAGPNWASMVRFGSGLARFGSVCSVNVVTADTPIHCMWTTTVMISVHTNMVYMYEIYDVCQHFPV